MTDLQRVSNWFGSGRLVRPGRGPDLVDLSRAISSLAGVPGLRLSPAARRLRAAIGPAEHLVLVLIDGFGVEQLGRTPPGGFLRRGAALRISSVFPSTTAAALTSLATGRHPAEHGVLAWWLRLPEHDLTATILPFVERFGGRELRALGVRPEEIFTVPSLTARMRRRALAVLPKGLVGSVYSTYSTGGTPQAGYRDLDEAFALAERHVSVGRGPSFTYLYLPQADGLAHEEGCSAPGVLELLAAYDRLLARLVGRAGRGVRIAVTGDHGQVDVPPERTLMLDEGSPLAECLVCPPSGERTVPFLHVRPGRGREFAGLFRREFGRHFALLSVAQALRLGLFRPARPDRRVLARLGDFLALAGRPSTLNWRPRRGRFETHVGVHAGLSPEEMTMPVVLARGRL
jgi:hypothetical protein